MNLRQLNGQRRPDLFKAEEIATMAEVVAEKFTELRAFITPAINGHYSAYIHVAEIEGVVAIGSYRTRTAALRAIIDCRAR